MLKLRDHIEIGLAINKSREVGLCVIVNHTFTNEAFRKKRDGSKMTSIKVFLMGVECQ